MSSSGGNTGGNGAGAGDRRLYHMGPPPPPRGTSNLTPAQVTLPPGPPPTETRSSHEADGRSVHSAGSGSGSGGGGKWSETSPRHYHYGLTQLGGAPPPLPQPPYLRWAESLDRLLEDSEGVSLFKLHLENEGSPNMLDFWFACQGFKRKVDPGETRKIYQIIKAIYREYIRNADQAPLPLRPETRRAITERISRKQGLDQSVFDQALSEVEQCLRQTAYPGFLKSDVYIHYVQAGGEMHSRSLQQQYPVVYQLKQQSQPTQPPYPAYFPAPPIYPQYQTTQTQPPLLPQPQFWPSPQPQATNPFPCPPAPVMPAGPVAAAGLPTLDEDRELGNEELQPMVITTPGYYPTASNPLVGTPPRSSPTSRHHGSSTVVSGSSTGNVGGSPALLTTENLHMTRLYRAELSYRKADPVPGYLLHSEQGTRPPNPYHVSYAPASAQDSELQSLSSDALTDDTRSLTDSSLDGNNALGRTRWKHQRRAIRRSAQHNRDPRELAQTLIPRSMDQWERGPVKERNLAETDPAAFACVLVEKLEKVVVSQNAMDRIEKLMAEVPSATEETSPAGASASGTNPPDSNPRPQGPGVNPAAMLGAVSSPGVAVGGASKASVFRQPWAGRLIAAAQQKEDAQAILEDHCSRIWAEQTPSGGTLSPHQCTPGATLHQHRHVHHHQHHFHAPPAPSDPFAAVPPPQASAPSVQIGAEPGPAVIGGPGWQMTPSPTASSLISMQSQHLHGPGSDKVLAWIYEHSTTTTNTVTTTATAALSVTPSVPAGGDTHRSHHGKKTRSRSASKHRHHEIPQAAVSVAVGAAPGFVLLPPASHQQQPIATRSPVPTGSQPQQPPHPTPDKQQPQDTPHTSGSTSSCGTGRRSGTPGLPAGPTPATTSADLTSSEAHLVVGYYLLDDPVPYRSLWPAREITLGQFKLLIAKKGSYRFFFKKVSDEFESGVVHQEISNEDEILPLWEGKVVAKVEKVE